MAFERLFRLDNKVAVVTGSAGIIGSQVARLMLEAGAKVALFDFNAEANQAIFKSLPPEHQENALALECDVTSQKSIDSAVRRTLEKFSRIDILHNNAASKSSDLNAFFAPFEDYSLDEWRKIMSVNVDGMMLMAQAVGRQMVAQGTGGSIVQTGSIYGVVGPDNRIYEGSEYLGRKINTPAVYAASKGAVVALTKYLATYWGDRRIRVNTVTPGGVESGQNAEFQKRYSARVPLGRMGRAEEIASAVLFLASDAASYVHGQNLIVDGGLTAW
jgi:NAD(P)-dependent dehydrogenase (short-subunit alcohol dehydrogenase family)